MPRFALQPLLEHAQHRLEAAERLLRMIRRKEEAAAQRRDELKGYLDEYRARLAGDSQGGMDIRMYRDFHRFIGKLEVAIRHQEGEVEQLHARWLAAQESWFEQRRKVQSFEVLAERHRVNEERREERREQRQFDEYANRQAHAGRDRGE